MQTQVAKLRRVMSLLEPAVPKSPTMPILKYIRLGEGKAVATDLDVVITVELPDADDGVCLVPFATVENFLRYTPGSLRLGIVPRDGRIHLLAEGSEASFPTEAPEEYPSLLTVGEDTLSAVVDGDDLVKGLAALVEYSARAADRPVLTAVSLMLQEPMEVAAADGFRLAVNALRTGFPGGEGQQILVPGDAIKALKRVWSRAPGPPDTEEGISIAELVVARRPMWMEYDGEAHVLLLRFGEVTVALKLVEGTFPNYRQLIPTQFTSHVTVHAGDFYRALRQVDRVAKDVADVVRLTWEDGQLTVQAKAEEVGDVEVVLRADVDAPGRIAFNINYLLGYLKRKDGPVTLSATDPAAPSVLTHQGINVVLMPLTVQWDGEETPAEAQDSPDDGSKAQAEETAVDPSDDPKAEEPVAETSDDPKAEEPAVETSDEPKPKRKRRGRKKQDSD